MPRRHRTPNTTSHRRTCRPAAVSAPGPDHPLGLKRPNRIVWRCTSRRRHRRPSSTNWQGCRHVLGGTTARRCIRLAARLLISHLGLIFKAKALLVCEIDRKLGGAAVLGLRKTLGSKLPVVREDVVGARGCGDSYKVKKRQHRRRKRSPRAKHNIHVPTKSPLGIPQWFLTKPD